MVPEENQPQAPPGPPANRAELERALANAGAMPAGPAWKAALNGYLTWNPTCPLGVGAYAHVLSAEGSQDEAWRMYRSAVEAEPELPLPEPRFATPEPVPPEPEPADVIAHEPVPPEPEEENLAHLEPIPPEPEELEHAYEQETVPDTESLETPNSEEEKEEDPYRKEKITSLIIAGAIHIVLIIVFSVWAVSQPRVRPPQILAQSLPEDTSESNRKERLKKEVATPPAMAAKQVDVISSVSVAPVTLPTVMTDNLNPNPVSVGASFAPSLDFGSGGTGEIAFFGSKAKAQKLVYVVDVSGSMDYGGTGKKTRVELMKEELTRSVLALPPGTFYQVIFFSSHAWFAGNKTNEVEFTARFGNGSDPSKLPTEPLIRAIPSRQRETVRQIEKTETGGGTNWRLPLKMAIKLEPDVIYFLTDGEIDADSGERPVIDDVVDYNASKSRARINSICLMEMKAFDELKELSNRTRGTVFLVQEDGTVVQGLQLNNLR